MTSLASTESSRDLPASEARAVTLLDVARLAGVSKSTAAQACRGVGQLSEQTRATVLQAARQLNYRPNLAAQRLSHGQSHDLVGIVCPALPARTTMLKVLSVQRELVRHNFEVPLYCFDNFGDSEVAELETVSRLCRQRPRAILCAFVELNDAVRRELEDYQRGGGIVVFADDAVDFACDNIVFDREHNSYQGTRHLLEMGHRELGFYAVDVVARPCEPLSELARQSARYQGFARALREFGVAPRPTWLWQGNDDEESGAALAQSFLELPARPSALCIVNEHVASAFLNQIARAGLGVPADVSLISHDDMPAAAFAAVPLTTVSQPVAQIAIAIAQTLLSRLDESYKGPPRRLVLRGNLIERESVAPMIR